MRIAFYDTHKYEKEIFETVNQKYKFDITYFDFKLNETTCASAKGFDVLCIFVNDVVSEKVIRCLREYKVQMIALRCSGFNNVDIEAAFMDDITVVRVPSYSPHSIAEHTVGLILSLIRKLPQAYVRTRGANFSLEGLVGTELYGKTVGVIGTGSIGKITAEILKGFGCNIILYDIVRDQKWANKKGFEYCTLPEVFQQSDIISLHCPLTDQTRHIINEGSVNLLKKNCILVNTSRGGLIDSKALINALKAKKIVGAALDVYEEESEIFFKDLSYDILTDDMLARLLTFPNVIITSHQAFLTNEALKSIAETTLENIYRLDKEEVVDNVIIA